MRFNYLCLFFLLYSLSIEAQPWLELLPAGKSRQQLTFKDYQKAFYDYWAPYNVRDGYYEINGSKVKAVGYKQFKRWEWLQEQRTHPVTGKFPSQSAYQIVKAHQKQFPLRMDPSLSQWTSLGPSSSNSNADGLGRINTIAFHPLEQHTYWAGSPSGGFWVTRDNGQSWTCLTDHLESLGTTDVVIDKNFEASNTIYIATGDRDSYDNSSIGVMKSTDGGHTWNATGLVFALNELHIVNRILQDYNNPDILYAATDLGVFKTSNGGDTWDELLTEVEFIDMEIHPVNPQILYGSTDMGVVHVSTNGGYNWQTKFLEAGGRRTELAVTPADPLRLYAITTSGGLDGVFRSDDEGNTFYETLDGDTLNIMHWNSNGIGVGGQAWYDLALAASPDDPDMLVAGGINTWLSKDGGYTWKIVSGLGGTGLGDAVHVDKHFLQFRNEEIWEGNDGGIFVTYDTGYTWIDKTHGMAISQMYRLGVSQTEPFELLTGLQDNGTKYFSLNTWSHVTGGDGMEAMIDHTNADIQYSSSQYGNLFRTYDRWKTIQFVKPQAAGEGDWVTPFVMDPVNPDIIYAGFREIWKSTDRCTTWSQISEVSAAGKIKTIAIAPSDPNVIYFAETYKIWKSTTGIGPFEKLNVTQITNTNQITYLSVKHDDPQTVWVSIGGFWEPGVWVIRDGGASYENISEGLPPIPVFCVIQNKLYDGVQLFAGTELGVYVKTDDQPWMPFNQGLPNVIVSELEIYYAPDPAQSKLRAATYGRGVWETRIEFNSTKMEFVASACTQASLANVKPNQDHEEILQITITTDGDLEPLHLYSMLFDTYGSTDAMNDINGTRLYSTGGVNAFSDQHELGYHAHPDGSFEFSFDQELIHGENYFWLAYDVSLFATLNNIIDGRFLSYNIGGEINSQLNDPSGSRLIELTYCDGGATIVGSEHISHVIAGNVDQLSNRGPDGYQDFTNQVIELNKGESIDVSIKNSNPHPTNELLVWVDWNQDGEMIYPGELYFKSGPSGQSTFHFSLAAPVDVRLGATRMRMRLHDSNFGSNWNPCGNSSLGEVEDYSVLLLEETTFVDDAYDVPFTVYPNPVVDQLEINSHGEGRKAKVELINVLGSVVRDGNVVDRLVIDVGGVVAGIYFLRVDDGVRVFVIKVVKG